MRVPDSRVMPQSGQARLSRRPPSGLLTMTRWMAECCHNPIGEIATERFALLANTKEKNALGIRVKPEYELAREGTGGGAGLAILSHSRRIKNSEKRS